MSENPRSHLELDSNWKKKFSKGPPLLEATYK